MTGLGRSDRSPLSPFKPGVLGSSPSRGASFLPHLIPSYAFAMLLSAKTLLFLGHCYRLGRIGWSKIKIRTQRFAPEGAVRAAWRIIVDPCNNNQKNQKKQNPCMAGKLRKIKACPDPGTSYNLQQAVSMIYFYEESS